MGNVSTVKAPARRAIRLSPSTASALDDALTDWFAQAHRKLKFRETRDPYAIMVSEFMLQQTTVVAVEPYYERFLSRFPTLADLAAASEDEVMQYWAGLGYYRRARQLRAAAIELATNWGGEFPHSLKDLQALPGFGRYTAGAVLSFAFDLPAPVLEANTIRVFARLAGRGGVIGDSAFTRDLWSISESLVNSAESPRMINLAAMELGALICKPKPRCEECPVQSHCVGFRRGNASTIPQPRPRREKISVSLTCIALRNSRGHYLVRRIPKGEWHTGLWEFPTARCTDVNRNLTQAQQLVHTFSGTRSTFCNPMTHLKFTVTHHEVTCHVFHCHADMETGDIADAGDELMFASLEQISAFAMGSAQKKLLKLLIEKAAEEKTK